MNIRHDGGRPDHDGAFDHAMRELHAQALTQVSPQVRAQLRAARTEASTQHRPMHGGRWLLAIGCAAVFALAIGLQWQGRAPATVPTQTAGSEAARYDADADADVIALATLDESPDLYLWLASNDDTLAVALER